MRRILALGRWPLAYSGLSPIRLRRGPAWPQERAIRLVASLSFVSVPETSRSGIATVVQWVSALFSGVDIN